MDAKGIEKTFGIRIPVIEHGEYYIETLLKSKEKISLKREIDAFEKFEMEVGIEKIKDYKSSLIQNSVSYLKEILAEKINSWVSPEKFVLETNEFKPEHNKCYISFDVKQANWTVTKYFLGLDYPSWEEYSQDILGFPEAIVYSKPIRQAVLGQVVNPKKYDSMQKYLTWKHLLEIKNKISNKIAKVVSINSEEIILEVLKGNNDLITFLNSDNGLNWLVSVKFTIFETKIHDNFGDKVIVKEFLNEDFSLKCKSLYSVNGHRFYMHFKTLILEEELDVRDTLFRLEGKTYQWCGIDMKDYKEYEYVKKWIKKLYWLDDNKALLNNKVLYYVINIDDEAVTIYDVNEKEEIYLNIVNKKYKDVISLYHYDKIQKFIQ